MSASRVVVAMSGGVDSSVAAALLKEQGCDVRGVTYQLLPRQMDAVPYARAVAAYLGIPHHVLDLSQFYASNIIEPFCHAYHAGRTPNPCVNCNRYVKFGILLEYAREQGADLLATGHYARIARSQGSKLLKANDKTKDQSYFLYTLTQPQLEMALFPLGEMLKTEVRQMAARLGVAKLVRQEESQDICFIPGGDYASFVVGHQTPEPGEIVNTSGQVLGKHRGLAYYTIGQRKGLGIAAPEPLYVVKLDAARNQVVAGPQEALYRPELAVSDITWINGHPPQDLAGITARVRFKSPEVAVSINILHNTAQVTFSEPQRGIAPGQSVVFYRGDEVLGGGIIQE